MERALEALRKIEKAREDAEVEAHGVYSDEELKKAIAQLQQALSALKSMGGQAKA